MSLWELEDAAAREWVRFFYEARLSKSATVDESARQAALASLRERRARGQSVHPFFWAGFLSVDGWR